MSITEDQNIWSPGIYSGREGDYAKKLADVSFNELIELVQKRAHEDGQWAINNGHVGNNEVKMRRMMNWVSAPENIQQCLNHILKEELESVRTEDYVCQDMAHIHTVDYVCRDLANESKWARL